MYRRPWGTREAHIHEADQHGNGTKASKNERSDRNRSAKEQMTRRRTATMHLLKTPMVRLKTKNMGLETTKTNVAVDPYLRNRLHALTCVHAIQHPASLNQERHPQEVPVP